MSWWGRFNCLDLTLNSMKLHIQDLLPKFIRQHFWRGTFKENSKSVTLTTEHCKTNILVNNTFSTVISRPSSTERFKYLIQRSAPSTVSIVTNAKPRDSLVRGSVTKWHSVTWNKICKGLFHKTKKKSSQKLSNWSFWLQLGDNIPWQQLLQPSWRRNILLKNQAIIVTIHNSLTKYSKNAS